VAAAIPARAEGGLLRATRVDHVSLAVGDSHKAMLFYRRLFGNEVLKDNKTEGRFLRLGPCYMAVASARAGEAKRIDHAALAWRTSVVRGGAVVRLRTRVMLATRRP
jgi:catechol-2,3-dioxygenase